MAMITDTQATIGFSGSFLTRLMAAVHAVADVMRFHRTLRELGTLDDRTLRDIGLIRGDLIELRMASSAEALRALTLVYRAR
ncbi:MAG: hypothetical protein JWM58_351 [Rhizobium sp.]|nr:hypothetical protein [Rhizobium sp.]